METTSIQESEPIVSKVSDTEISITREITRTSVETKTNTYSKDFLLKQKDQINEQRDTIAAQLNEQLADNAAKRVAELAECATLLEECEKAGLKIAAEVQAEVTAEEESI